MRSWLGLTVILWSATAAADPAFTAAPLAGALDGALSAIERPTSEANRKTIDRLVEADLQQDPSRFVGIDARKGPGIGGNAEGDFVANKPAERPVTPGTIALESSGDTPDEVNRVVRSRAGVLRACYQKELAKRKDLAGKIMVRFTVGADGTVSKASVTSSTMKSPAVESCIVTQIQRLKFPAKGADLVVNYPFIFTSG